MREIMETVWSLQDLGAKLEVLSGPLAGIYDPRGMGQIFFRARRFRPDRTRDHDRTDPRRAHPGRPAVISKDMMRVALGRRADGESVTSIAKGLTYKTASGEERTVSRRTLYHAFKTHDAERASIA